MIVNQIKEMSTVLIEFHFFDGCHNADSTLQHLHEVMAEQGISENNQKLTLVPGIESAKTLNFQTSVKLNKLQVSDAAGSKAGSFVIAGIAAVPIGEGQEIAEIAIALRTAPVLADRATIVQRTIAFVQVPGYVHF